jgi:hypothetical protein
MINGFIHDLRGFWQENPKKCINYWNFHSLLTVCSGKFKRFSATAVKVYCFEVFSFVGNSPTNLIIGFNEIHLKFPSAMTSFCRCVCFKLEQKREGHLLTYLFCWHYWDWMRPKFHVEQRLCEASWRHSV